MAANCSATLLNISWMADEFQMKAELILNLFAKMSQFDVAWNPFDEVGLIVIKFKF